MNLLLDVMEHKCNVRIVAYSPNITSGNQQLVLEVSSIATLTVLSKFLTMISYKVRFNYDAVVTTK